MSDKLIPQRVYIKYSVDFKEVPDRVSIMLNELSNNLTSLSGYFQAAALDAPTKPAIVMNNLAEYNSLVQKILIRIGDTHEILANYMEILQAAAKIDAEHRRQAQEQEQEGTLKVVKRVTTVVKGI